MAMPPERKPFHRRAHRLPADRANGRRRKAARPNRKRKEATPTDAAEPTGAEKPQPGRRTDRRSRADRSRRAEERAAIEEPDETVAEAAEVAELEALDGVTDTSSSEAAQQEPAAEASQEPATEEPPARTRKAGRPGMSLLDFAQWGKEEPAAKDAGPKQVALVEMEEAAALDERARPRLSRKR